MGVDYETFFPGRFIKSAEFGGRDVMLTIDTIRLEDLPDKMRGVITFTERSRKTNKQLEWVLNRTNAECLRALWGRDTSAWLGKRVTLFAQPMNVGGENITGIRVRGSPDLERDQEIQFSVRQKSGTKTVNMTMRATGKRPANGKPATAAQQQAPSLVDDGTLANDPPQTDEPPMFAD